MARAEFSRFYHSKAWLHLSQEVRTRAFHLCQLCQRPGNEVHHIIPITLDNIDNPLITLNPDNLICLCHDCHNAIHNRYLHSSRSITFDSSGRPIAVQEPNDSTLTPELLAIYRSYQTRANSILHTPPYTP
jgi:5-methylcytosine-specific restriction protein A